MPDRYAINSLTLDTRNDHFESHGMRIGIRPYLQSLQQSGKYPFVTFIDFMSGNIGNDPQESRLLEQLEQYLSAVPESEPAGVITFHVTDAEKRRCYIYTYLRPNEFMRRANGVLHIMHNVAPLFRRRRCSMG